jgi:hypothetical protein
VDEEQKRREEAQQAFENLPAEVQIALLDSAEEAARRVGYDEEIRPDALKDMAIDINYERMVRR